MFVTDLKKTEAVDVTPEKAAGRGKVFVRWLLGEPEGAPNFEMRYFSLQGPVSTDWHTHSWEHQVYVIAGKGRLRTENKENALSPGSAVLVAPGEKHQFINDGDIFDFICVVPRGTRVCSS